MSWNLSRTINNIQFDVEHNTQDIDTLENKTIHIDSNISPTMNVNSAIIATGFISNQQIGDQAGYLMSNGTISISSQAGQPNIYLYNNNNNLSLPVQNGQIRANNLNNQLVTELYISQLTSDNIDIDVFLLQITTLSIIYMQDRNNSANNVRFNVTGSISVVPNVYVSVPVVYSSAQGSGVVDFGAIPIFMSIFDNSAIADARISALETKTQNLSASTDTNTLTHSTNFLLDNGEYFAIRNLDQSVNYLTLSENNISISAHINMQNQSISNASSLSVSSGNANQYLMADGSLKTDEIPLTSNIYYYRNSQNPPDPLEGDICYNALENETVSTIYLSKFDRFGVNLDAFVNEISTLEILHIQDENDPTNWIKYYINSIGINETYLKLTVEFYKGNDNGLTNFGENTAIFLSIYTNDTKINNAIGSVDSLLNKTAFLENNGQNSDLLNGVNVILPVGSGASFLIRNTASPFPQNRMFVTDTGMTIAVPSFYSNQNITGVNNITCSKFIKSTGLTSQFLKANGDIDSSIYLTAIDLTTLNTKTQNIAATFGQTTITKNMLLSLDTSLNESFSIRDQTSNFMFFINNTNMTLFRPINANGNIINSLGTPSNNNDAANKVYVDTQDNLKLNLTGGNVSGAVISTSTITSTGFIKTGSSALQFLKGDGTTDSTVYLTSNDLIALNNKTQNITATSGNTALTKSLFITINTSLSEMVTIRDQGTNLLYLFNDTGMTLFRQINANNQIITGLGAVSSNSTITASSFIRSGGLVNQFLKANGSIDSNNYTTVTTINGTATYNSANISVTAKRVGIVGHGVCSVFISGFTSTVQNTTSTIISTSVLPLTYRPQNAIFLPCRMRKAASTIFGICVIFAGGEIGFTDVGQTGNFWTTGETCGLTGDFTVSFPTT